MSGLWKVSATEEDGGWEDGGWGALQPGWLLMIKCVCVAACKSRQCNWCPRTPTPARVLQTQLTL